MLLLMFEIRDGRYAMPTNRIVEIVPLVKMKKIPRTPEYVVGMINFRGLPVPVLDLGLLTENIPCAQRFSTRNILVRYQAKNDRQHIIGLIAERVTETVKIDMAALPASGVMMDEALYVGALGSNDDDMVRCFDVQRMVPESIIEMLFPA
ncbi:MAG: hypothetical protein A2511_07010 [Deltaproteobacteria bacterium RIFOXYD12_FULL_50_9]|nr:MAG: hypothetical protein A2511_07010 [Deltaproteobacteria bacterium RIFOXYD12_FULL_50_9]